MGDLMAIQLTRKHWTLAGAFLGVGLTSWVASMGVARVGATYLELPDKAELPALDIQPEAGAGGEEGGAESKPVAKGRDRKKGKHKAGKTAESGFPEDGAPPAEGEPPTDAIAGAEPGEPEDDAPRGPGRSAEAGRRPNRDHVSIIVQRNIFDPSKVGAGTEEPSSDISGAERRSDLKVVLLATVVAEPAEYSSALIAEDKKSKGSARGYGIEDDLIGEAKIVRIEQRKVYIRRSDGNIEYISMDEEKPGVPGAAAEGDGVAAADAEGVQKVDDTHFVVEQALIDQMLANPEKLYSQIRAVPHKDASGAIDGYRLSGIRRKSVFSQLGIKNGDVVHAVNGKAMGSMGQAMEAFNSLQNEKNFTFEVTRRNNRQTFEYEIR
jgi:type II secretion system protein C